MEDPQKPTFGKYIVKGVLGEGGMGRVWEGFDPDLEVRVAIKELKEQFRDQNNLERFYREAQIAAKCRHPNIVLITDLSKDPPYFVMEFLAAKELSVYAHKGKPISLRRMVHILGQVCDGLGFLHGRGIFHRDLKPANIMLLEDDTVKITDFGISKAPFGQATVTQVIMGTIPYMSPEQITTPGKVDHRVDVWALGVILYELTQRRHPFPGEGDINTIFHIVHSPAAAYGPMPPPVEEKLKGILDKALEKEPGARISGTREFKTMLRGLLEGIPDPNAIMFPYEAAVPAAGPSMLLDVRADCKALVAEISRQLETGRELLEASLAERGADQIRIVQNQIQEGNIAPLLVAMEELGRLKATIERSLVDGINRYLSDAEELMLSGEFLEAARMFGTVLRTSPGRTEAQRGIERAVEGAVEQGRLLAENDDIEGAIKLWREVVQIQPAHDEAARLIGYGTRELRLRELLGPAENLFQQSRLKEALALTEQALDLDKEHEQALELRDRIRSAIKRDETRVSAEKAAEAGKFKEARSLYKQLLPDEAAAKKLKEIEGILKEKEAAEWAAGLTAEAESALRAGDFEKAIRLFDEAAETLPGDAAIRNGREKARKRLEVLHEAERDAAAKEKAGDLSGAVKIWEQVLQVQPSHPTAGREVERIHAFQRQEEQRRREAEERLRAEEEKKLRLQREAEERRRAEEEKKLRLQREAEELRRAEEEKKLRLQREAEERRKAEEAARLRRAAEESFKAVEPWVSLIRGIPAEDRQALGVKLVDRAAGLRNKAESALEKSDAAGIRGLAGDLQKAAEELRAKRQTLLAQGAARIKEAAAALEEALQANQASLKPATVNSAREAMARASREAGGPALHPLAAHVDALGKLRESALREVREALKAGRESVQKALAVLETAASKNKRAVAKRPELARKIDTLAKQAAGTASIGSLDVLARLEKDLRTAKGEVPLDPVRFLPHAIAAAVVVAAVAGFLGWRWVEANTRHAYELHIVPWGRVVSVQNAAGKEETPPQGDSPFLEMSLLPGKYTITVENPGTGKRSTVTASIPADTSGTVKIEGPDYKSGVRELLKRDPFLANDN